MRGHGDDRSWFSLHFLYVFFVGVIPPSLSRKGPQDGGQRAACEQEDAPNASFSPFQVMQRRTFRQLALIRMQQRSD
jgi:hypothetical protein